MMEDKVMKNRYLSIILVLIGTCFQMLIINLFGQDDIYYMPSKNSSVNSGQTNKTIDTTGMTDYEKYRALRESNIGAQSTSLINRDKEIDSTNRNSVFDSTNSITLNPAYVVVNNDTTNGSVTINNYYLDNDDRYSSYRRMYFDYYYSPYYYDPFYWDFSYGWGGPYFGFHYGYGSPYYYGYYDNYWYYPYGYYPYYCGGCNYWGGNYGYNSGYYNNYNHQYGSVNYSGGRRLGGYSAPATSGSSAYYGGRFAGADNYHGTRRGANATVGNSSATNSASSIRRQTSWDSYNGVSVATVRRSASSTNRVVATTRPYDNSARRNSTGYTPTYSMPGTNSRSLYNVSNNEGSRRQTLTNSNQSSVNNYVVNSSGSNVRRSTGSSSNYVPVRTENSGSNYTPAPRRSNENYTPPVRTTSQSTTSDGGSRRSSSPSYSSGGSSSQPSNSSSGSSGHSSGSGRRR
jgi:hypothetical protein